MTTAPQAADGRLARLAAAVDRSTLGRLWQRLVEVEFVDRSIALAAKAFVSLFPLVAVAAAITPPVVGQSILTSITTRFGLEGRSLDLVREAFASADQIRTSTSVVGVVLTVLFAVSFTTALQRCYLRVWRRPPRGSLRDRPRAIVWLAMAIAFLAMIGAVSRVLTGPPGTVAAIVLGMAGSTGLWWWTAHTLLRGDVRWRPLLPTAIATGVGSALYAAAASIWMPRVISENVAQFGWIGVSLSFVTWFVGFGFLLLAAIALGPALAEGEGRLARWVRGPDDAVLTPGAPPALPGPASPPRLLDRFARSSDEAELTDS
jgi:membrane protein